MTDQINLGLIWAGAGGTSPVTETKYAEGWVAEIPTFQNFNFMLQGLDQNILHFAEYTSFNWQADIAYKLGAKVAHADKVYTCKVANIGIDPTSDSTNSYWVSGSLIGSAFGNLLESDGFKVELPVRSGSVFGGVDESIVNSIPILELRTTGATNNLALANVAGEAVVMNLGQSGPDARPLAKDAGNSHRIFHEGHFPQVSEVVGAIPEPTATGKSYARVGNSPTTGHWVEVTSTTVRDVPPPPVNGAGQGWYNLADGQFYLDINDGDSSQWVHANPPVIPATGVPIVVSDAPPPPTKGSGQGWYNLSDGQFYLDVEDGNSSQWVHANPTYAPKIISSGVEFTPTTTPLGTDLQTVVDALYQRILALEANHP